jgi:hypothetical protein
MSFVMDAIQLSRTETRLLDLRVGHLTVDRLLPDAFVEALLAGRFDLCRLKLRSRGGAAEGVSALEETGLPYFHAGGILRYHFDYRERPYEARYAVPEDLDLVPVDARSDAELEKLVRRCFREDPIGYYRTPYLSRLFPKDAELDCLVEHNLLGDRAGRVKVLAKLRDEPVGFIVMTAADGVLHTDLCGVIPERRRQGIFNCLRDHIHLHASGLGLREEEGARLDNVQSQVVFEQDGLEHFDNETVFHVTPFLARSELEPLHLQLPPAAGPAECDAAVDEALPRVLDLDGFGVRRRWLRPPGGEAGRRISVRVPIRSDDLVLVVAEREAAGAGPALRYTEYRRRA